MRIRIRTPAGRLGRRLRLERPRIIITSTSTRVRRAGRVNRVCTPITLLRRTPQSHNVLSRYSNPPLPHINTNTNENSITQGVIEPISQTTLTGFLTQRFGAVKDVEIVRSKACAFLEFLSLDAARRAIIASLPQGQGGEGGLWIEVGGDVGQVRISVEMKKERGDRPVSRPRGGAPGAAVNGEAVGSGQGVGGGAGRGSGGGGGGNFRGRGGMRGRGGGGGGSGTVGK